jgi:chemotaxis protein MotB
MADDKPIIIIKKKGGHGGHHGGAWKVAYADFVTAMMAFFMVMWLVNTADQSTKQNIASYFRKPGLFQSGSGTPLLIGEAGILQDAFVPPHKADTTKQGGKDQDQALPQNTGTDEAKDQKRKVTIKGESGKAGGQEDAKGKQGLAKDNTSETGKLIEEKPQGTPQNSEALSEEEMLAKLAESIKEQIAASKELSDMLGIVDVKVDADGLNVEIMDTEKTSMFASGSARVLPEARAAFVKLAEILKKVPNSIDLVGHTDGKPFASRPGGYSNWELSSDRAQAARRILEQEGIESARFTSVIGRADKDLKLSGDPLAAANRRITLKMRFKFNKNINLAKNPKALDNPEEILASEAKATQPGVISQTPAQTQATEEKVHSLTPKQLTNESYKPKKAVSAKEKNDRIQLPDANSGNETPRPPGGDIFRDNPVIGPKDLFANF